MRSDEDLRLKAYTGLQEQEIVPLSPDPQLGKTGLGRSPQSFPCAHSLTFQPAYILYNPLASLEAASAATLGVV